MKHDDFKIGSKFSSGGKFWLCTDVGTRVITAIPILHLKDKSWQKGPPYKIEEIVFSEFDFDSCRTFSG